MRVCLIGNTENNTENSISKDSVPCRETPRPALRRTAPRRVPCPFRGIMAPPTNRSRGLRSAEENHRA
ncbi:hypothetical protein TPA0909_37800 [Streptomyces albus]|nr:hypothetical protein TPA0909_37800 [Streptomyces albus]